MTDRRPRVPATMGSRPDRTYRRIVDAALELYRTIGPAATTISAVAARAGVQRLTVYRHVGDDEGLVEACREGLLASAPLPDPAAWTAEHDPVDRCLTAFDQLWSHYAADDGLLAGVLRDGSRQRRLARLTTPYREMVERAVVTLADGWTDDPARMPVVRGAIRLAVDYATWRILIRDGGLDPGSAADVLVGMIEAAAEPVD